MVSTVGPVRKLRTCCRSASVWNSLGCFCRRAEHGCAELAFSIGRYAHQDEAADDVERRLADQDTNDDNGQHDEGVDAAATQDPVRKLEQVDWNGQQQQVHGKGEHTDHEEVAAAAGEAAADDVAKILVA
jgi:hypothetical protein